MAGKKGRSGGARPNTGGARPGAGRKPKRPEGDQDNKPVPQSEKDMLQFLQDVALGRTDASPLQVRAAIAAVQYTHHKKEGGGKKEEKSGAAKKAGSKFPAAPAPLRAVK